MQDLGDRPLRWSYVLGYCKRIWLQGTGKLSKVGSAGASHLERSASALILGDIIPSHRLSIRSDPQSHGRNNPCERSNTLPSATGMEQEACGQGSGAPRDDGQPAAGPPSPADAPG
jgi:hypothetical protein